MNETETRLQAQKPSVPRAPIIVMFNTEMRRDVDAAEYQKTAQRMWEIVSSMPGFVSLKRCTADDGETFAIATFESEDALKAWRNHPDHRAVQRRGREEFYDSYWVRVCKVIRETDWKREPEPTAI